MRNASKFNNKVITDMGELYESTMMNKIDAVNESGFNRISMAREIDNIEKHGNEQKRVRVVENSCSLRTEQLVNNISEDLKNVGISQKLSQQTIEKLKNIILREVKQSMAE